MRAEHIVHARCGELELRVVPAQPPLAAKVVVIPPSPAEADEDPNAEARHSLEALLYSSGADPAAFVRAYGLEAPASKEPH